VHGVREAVPVRLLDLFCGAGGASVGYARAGFEVVGVDHVDQPRYPYDFIRADALAILRRPEFLADFDVVHASPPCQAWSAYRRRRGVNRNAVDLIWITRRMLMARANVWVIENVPGAPLVNPVQLCGSSFGLYVRRHRLFESNVALVGSVCSHPRERAFPPASNRPNPRFTVEVGTYRVRRELSAAAMGTHWMTGDEMTQAIPPAYTAFLGEQLLGALTA
jgi:DNA (cytosine-5)-methyltransferase 1